MRIFAEGLPGLQIEAVEDATCPGHLVLCVKGSKTRHIRPSLHHEGITYLPGLIAPGLSQFVRFPTAQHSLNSTEHLVGDIEEFLCTYLDQDDHSTQLLVAFILATWFADCFQVAPVIFLDGPDNEVIVVLRLLNALCYHPVLVGDLDMAALATLPNGLRITFLISQADLSPRVGKVLLASTRRDLHVLSGNRSLNIFGARALRGNFPSDQVGINLSITPRRRVLPGFNETEDRARSDEFQSRLLTYRLGNVAQVRRFTLDADSIYLGLEDQMTAWLASLPKDSEINKSVLLSFAESHERSSSARFEDPNCLVAEAALMFCHRKGAEHFYVRELAEKVNDLLLGRHADFKLEHRKIGSVLKNLGIRTHRVTRGYRVKLEESRRKRIHHIANSYRVLSITPKINHCAHCINEFSRSKQGHEQMNV